MNIEISELKRQFLQEKNFIYDIPMLLRDDFEVVLSAIKKNRNLLELASDNLKNNKKLIQEAIKIDPKLIDYASEILKNDVEIMTKVVEISGICLRYGSDEIKKNKEIVLKAINNSPFSICYVAPEMSDDLDVVTTALELNGNIGFTSWIYLGAWCDGLLGGDVDGEEIEVTFFSEYFSASFI
eukprot:gene8618-565_t